MYYKNPGMMKTGKELKVINYKNYKIVFGSVNNKNPKAVYINISAWAEPQYQDDVNYSRVIRELNKHIKQSIFNLFNLDETIEFSKDRTIVDLDIRESGIRYGKRSFMNCELTLFLKSELMVNSDLIKPMLGKILDTIIYSNFEYNKTFNFYKKKK